ncbi:MAG TPA: SprT family zinc-dependent metalloprotease [Methanothrix soehngenii]|nr:SprT family zinc-dependent metalloprotease [Methanothrix soehngenii]
MTATASIEFGTSRIDYDVKYSSRRKNLSIAVHPNKKLEVLAPPGLSQEEIQGALRRKAGWVKERLDWFEQMSQLAVDREYVSGETFLYLGRQYRLKIVYGTKRSPVKLRGKFFEVNLSQSMPEQDRREAVRRAMWRWYRAHAREKIREIVEHYSARLGIEPPEFRIKYQAKRWGSCSQGSVLNINLRIIMAPLSQIEYVVAHELCHLKYKDHSAAFWDLLRLVMPNYEVRKENLRRSGWQYLL